MKFLSTALRRGAIATVLSLGAMQAASATVIDFGFTGSGSAVFAPCGANCIEGSTFGLADDNGDAIPGSWSTSLNFTALTDTGAVTGTWSFLDVGATTNDLFGTFTATLAANGQSALVSYLVTGGDGLFNNFTGFGSSTLAVTDIDPTGFADFTEVGTFATHLIPEPATVSLLFAAAAVGLGSRRRRKSS
jgi:hypothetical protein